MWNGVVGKMRRNDRHVRGIAVVGVGGLGCSVAAGGGAALKRLARVVCVDTDEQQLARCACANTVLLEAPYADAGGDLHAGRRAGEQAAVLVQRAITGSTHVIIVAGLGGSTGSGAAAVVARVARQNGCRVSAIVGLPLRIEAAWRKVNAKDGLHDLRAAADDLVVFSPDHLSAANRAADAMLTDGLAEIVRWAADGAATDVVGLLAAADPEWSKMEIDLLSRERASVLMRAA